MAANISLPLKQMETFQESPQEEEIRTNVKTPRQHQINGDRNSKEFADGPCFLDDTATKIKSSKRSGTGLNDASCISPFSNRIFNYSGAREVQIIHSIN